MTDDFVIAHTRAWLRRAVIGLNLCPFAKAVDVKGQIRYVVSIAEDTDALLQQLCDELMLLQQTPPTQIDTTLLIHPKVLQDFDDFNDFTHIADVALTQLGYQGMVQIASFHPDFQFADTTIDDISNATNRAPYPILHLLREDSIDKAVAAFPNAATIYEANIQTLTQLGAQGWANLRQQCINDAEQSS